MQLVTLIASLSKKALVISCVTPTFPMSKRGLQRDFKKIMTDEGLWEESRWNASSSTYTFSTGSVIEFFSADTPGKVQGAARDLLVIDEAYLISYEIARQLFVRTRGKVIIAYNPSASFWADSTIAPRDNARFIISTYKDNNYLTEEQIAEIESNKQDKNWWRVYGEGLVGQLEGAIYSYEVIDELPDPQSLVECYGMDFGFTNDPTAITHLLADTRRKILYVDEVCYKTGMTNDEIADLLIDRGVKAEVFADCAEPKSIAEIARRGLLIKPCKKTAPTGDKLLFQIQWLQGWKLYITKQSVNLIKELQNYCWMKDKDGNTLNKPISGWDHLMDSLRYAAWTKLNSSTGNYDVRFF